MHDFALQGFFEELSKLEREPLSPTQTDALFDELEKLARQSAPFEDFVRRQIKHPKRTGAAIGATVFGLGAAGRAMDREEVERHMDERLNTPPARAKELRKKRLKQYAGGVGSSAAIGAGVGAATPVVFKHIFNASREHLGEKARGWVKQKMNPKNWFKRKP